MNFFDVLSLVGGLSLFLFGMNIMGQALERRAGNRLQALLGKLTTNKFFGFFTGLAVTAIIQSSSATTVMVVGFVNSGLMTLRQAINVIMGANVGTTVTSWILSLGGIDSNNFFIKLLKPTSFTPVLALVGVILFLFCKSNKKKDTGTILLGFATLMFGMDAMSGAVAGLSEVQAFRELFVLFQNPFLGMLAGAVLTAIIQSSSASVGILQALALTGQISYNAAIPIIMGQNIGTCITALLSSVGANKNAKRAAFVHLSFNVIGTAVWLTVFSIVRAIFAPAILSQSASLFGIAICHTVFNILCTLLLLPMAGLLEKLANKLVHDAKEPEKLVELDERLLSTPAVALERARALTCDMAKLSVNTLVLSLDAITGGATPDLSQKIRDNEDKTDHYEDILGTYLVKLSGYSVGEAEGAEAAMLLRLIGDFERIADHSVNLVESAEEVQNKELVLSENAKRELNVLVGAVREILERSLAAFTEKDLSAAGLVEPLEEVIDNLKEEIRARHIARLQSKNCTIEAGFVLSDLLTNLERVSDHCSNIAACVLDSAEHNLNLHESTRAQRMDVAEFEKNEAFFAQKYSLSAK